MPSQYESSADHRIMNAILADHFVSYRELAAEIDAFEPLPISSFAQYKADFLKRIVELNPHTALDELEELAHAQTEGHHKHQFYTAFDARIKKLYVSVLFISQSLCEALINSILTLTFHDHEVSTLLGVWDKVNLLDKWALGPRTIKHDYDFDKGSAIFQTLREMVEARNTLVHYKPMIKVEGTLVQKGIPFKWRNYEETMEWIGRFLSLPFDLAEVMSILLDDRLLAGIVSRGEIKTAKQHQSYLRRIKNARSSPAA